RHALPAHFIGPVSSPLPYYAAADIYVHPTHYDPCSLVVLEAWACGLPVVTSRFNGCAELMPDGMSELVLRDPADAGELATRLGGLLDPHTRQRVGLVCRTLAEAHRASDCFAAITRVYEEASGARRAAA